MSRFDEGAPTWARNLAHGIRARLANTFILHGNTHDVVPAPGVTGAGGAVGAGATAPGGGGATAPGGTGATPPGGTASTAAEAAPATNSGPRFLPLAEFLAEQVFGQRDVVIEYQRANGALFHTRESHRRFHEVLEAVDTVHGTDYARSMPRDPGTFCALLDSFLKQAALRTPTTGVAILFPYAETLIPESAGEAGAEDRAVRVYFQKWATDPALLSANVTFVLMTENLADLSTRIVRSPQTMEIEVRRPDEAERMAFLNALRPAAWYAAHSDLPVERLAQLTSGLARTQLRQIVASVDERKARLDAATLRDQKKAVIEAECYGLLEYVESRFTLDMVSGHEGVKERMRRAAKAIQSGRLRGVPMGYLVAGPVGSAKTFLVNCFTGEIGFPCVKFLNFRSQWQGVTEGNLEKILKLLHAMWPVGVIIDEADAFLGDRNQQGDSGTSNRVFAQFATFMANTDYRGKIVWFLITSRPDLLPIDLKRQGRAEEHLALFYPQDEAEYDALFQIMVKKSGIVTPVASLREVIDDQKQVEGLSGADIEAILARAALLADSETASGEQTVSADVLRRVFADFVSASSALERELQVLAGVLECTSREILPAIYRDMDRALIQARINELKILLNDM